MRLSSFFQASFVGSLLFSPTMAQEADKMHEEALRILRESSGQASLSQTNSVPARVAPPGQPGTRVLSADDAVARSRAERERRLSIEAQKRLDERAKAQEQKRLQFEQYVKDRERLRQQQREYDEKLANQPGKSTGLVTTNNPVASDDLHEKALEILHQTTAQTPSESPQPALQPSNSESSAAAAVIAAPPAASANTSAAPVAEPEDDLQRKALEILREKKAQNPPSTSISGTQPPVTEAEVAPRLTTENDEVHARALKILHQQMQDSAAASTNAGPRPSPYLQQRLDQMKSELQAPAQQPGASATGAAIADGIPSQAPDDYVRQLEETARRAAAERSSGAIPPASTVTTSPAPANAPASATIVDPKIREMLERQNREIARQGETVSTRVPARPYISPRHALSPEAEALARQILEQQEPATVATTPSNAPELDPAVSPAPSASQAAVQPAPAPARSAQPIDNPSTGTIAPDNTQVGYSKELEERARQILLERAQNQTTTTPAPAPAPSTTPVAPSQTMPAPARATAAQTPSALPAPAQPAPAPAVTPAPSAPVTAATMPASPNLNDPRIDQIHAQALKALDQIESGAVVAPSGPASKQERLRIITDLYKADKMTPAEYHRQRAAIIASPK